MEKVQNKFKEIIDKHQKVEYKKSEELELQDDHQKTLTKILMEVEGLHYKMDCRRPVVNDNTGLIILNVVSITISTIILLALLFGS